MNCLCNRRGNTAIVSQLMTQIRDLQNQLNSLADAREFYDPETASSSGAMHMAEQERFELGRTLHHTLIIPSPGGMLSRDSGLPHDTRNTVGTSGNVFERLPAPEGPSSTLKTSPTTICLMR